MDVIKMTRELGKAIQQDEKYLNFMEAKNANEADDKLSFPISRRLKRRLPTKLK